MPCIAADDLVPRAEGIKLGQLTLFGQLFSDRGLASVDVDDPKFFDVGDDKSP